MLETGTLDDRHPNLKVLEKPVRFMKQSLKTNRHNIDIFTRKNIPLLLI